MACRVVLFDRRSSSRGGAARAVITTACAAVSAMDSAAEADGAAPAKGLSWLRGDMAVFTTIVALPAETWVVHANYLQCCLDDGTAEYPCRKDWGGFHAKNLVIFQPLIGGEASGQVRNHLHVLEQRDKSRVVMRTVGRKNQVTATPSRKTSEVFLMADLVGAIAPILQFERAIKRDNQTRKPNEHRAKYG